MHYFRIRDTLFLCSRPNPRSSSSNSSVIARQKRILQKFWWLLVHSCGAQQLTAEKLFHYNPHFHSLAVAHGWTRRQFNSIAGLNGCCLCACIRRKYSPFQQMYAQPTASESTSTRPGTGNIFNDRLLMNTKQNKKIRIIKWTVLHSYKNNDSDQCTAVAIDSWTTKNRNGNKRPTICNLCPDSHWTFCRSYASVFGFNLRRASQHVSGCNVGTWPPALHGPQPQQQQQQQAAYGRTIYCRYRALYVHCALCTCNYVI